MSIEEKQEILNAYYAGFNQAHYSHLHPEYFPPKEMVSAAKEWFEKTYREKVFVHHSGNVVQNEGDDLFLIP